MLLFFLQPGLEPQSGAAGGEITSTAHHFGLPGNLCGDGLLSRRTWQRGWGLWGVDGVLSFGDLTDPVLMGVAVEIVPPGEGPVGAAHHLDAFLAALVVVRLPGAPVGVR